MVQLFTRFSQYHGSLALSIKIFKKIYRQMKFLQIVICCLLQAKHLVITQDKDEGVKMVFSHLLQLNVDVELHII